VRPVAGQPGGPEGSPFNADAAQSAGGPPGLDALAGAGPAAKEFAAAIQGEIDRLTGEVATAQAQAAEHLSTLQRTAAEFANYRRRTTDEREREAGLASEYLLRKVLTIADDFDRAIEAMPAELADNQWMQGIVAIDRKLRGLLESEGVKPIESVGRPFDPREHEAITSVPATGRPDGEVIAEVQRGYRLRDRVLRPSLVAVAAGGESSNPTTHADDESTQDLND
jgi:molecular chaperone GrpE